MIRARIAARRRVCQHSRLRFQCFLASRHANQSLRALARELPNLSLAGYWRHNFFPEIIRQVIGERLDMLPLNQQVGFFSDAYCVEWAYAKSVLVRKQLAHVLADRIVQGQYSRDDAKSIARAVLYDSPPNASWDGAARNVTVLGMTDPTKVMRLGTPDTVRHQARELPATFTGC